MTERAYTSDPVASVEPDGATQRLDWPTHCTHGESVNEPCEECQKSDLNYRPVAAEPTWPIDCTFPDCDCVAGSECFRAPESPSVPAQIATKDFRQTVAERAGRDPEFREALVVERAEAKVREIAAPKERTMQGLVMKYFVLKPAGKDVYAAASRRAMNAYAKHIKDENPQLSEQLHNWAAIEGSEAYFGDKEPS